MLIKLPVQELIFAACSTEFLKTCGVPNWKNQWKSLVCSKFKKKKKKKAVKSQDEGEKSELHIDL